MKWYKKQMMAMKDKTTGLIESDVKKPDHSQAAQKLRGNKASHNPVAQRNLNRSKTDSK